MESLLLSDMTPLHWTLTLLVSGLLGVLIGMWVRHAIEKTKRVAFEAELAANRQAAEAEAKRLVAQAEAQAKSYLIAQREKFDAETESTRQQMRAEEKRLAKRDDQLDQKLEGINSKERLLDNNEKALVEREKGLAKRDRELTDLVNQQQGFSNSALKHSHAPGQDKFKDIWPRIDGGVQFRHAEKIGLGTADYKLVEI